MTSYSICYVTSDIDMDYNNNNGYSYFIVDSTNNDINITLTIDEMYGGVSYIFNKIYTNNTLRLTAPSGSTINGVSSIDISPKAYIEIMCYGSNWICSVFEY